MENREFDAEIFSNSKLPLKADWWRAIEKNEGIINDVSTEFSKTSSAEMKFSKDKETIIERNSTIDTPGQIEISDILFPIHIESEREIYEHNCQRFQCPSSRKFGKTLDNISTGFYEEDVMMAHYGLTGMGIKATTISISNLSQCSIIDLQGNRLSESSLSALVAVLKKSSVSDLNLSSTNISKFGPAILSKWIPSSRRIKRLLLRDNQFDDGDGITLFEIISNNRSLIQVDVAENNFCIRCADALKKLLDENDVLEALDLSWNHLRLNATMAIAKGLRRNNGLKILILSWNGIEDTTAKELGLSLRDNDTLQNLELDSNRITDTGFLTLMKGLEKNSALKSLKIGRNNITQVTAEKILESLRSGELRNCSIEMLDFTNNIFRSHFQTYVDAVRQIRPEFNCLFGYEDSYGKRKRIVHHTTEDAFQILMSDLKNKRVDLVELFHKSKFDSQIHVTITEFRQELKGANMPISDEQVNILIDYLDPNGTGEINLSKLMINDAETIVTE